MCEYPEGKEAGEGLEKGVGEDGASGHLEERFLFATFVQNINNRKGLTLWKIKDR